MLYRFVSLTVFALFVVFSVTGCGEDGPSWAGTWSLKSVDGQDWRALLVLFGATVEDKWTFHDDGTWDMEITVKILGGETQTEKMAGTYTITETTFTMSSPDPEFSLAPSGDPVDEETGTWVRDGSMLTLTLSDGQVLVFEKI